MTPAEHPSPNCSARRDGLRPGLIVLHYTAMKSAEAALERLCDPQAEVSAHYLIARDGRVTRLVEEDQRAWHAGAGAWGGRGDVNSRSIGIELDNDGSTPFSQPLMQALEALLPGIMQRWAIAPMGVIGHSDMAPERKRDPGRRFDWRRLALQGLAVWPEPRPGEGPVEAERFLEHARRFGYPDTLSCDLVLEALRQRFRPQATGPLSAEDMAVIADLAARFPVDRTGDSA